MNQNDKIEEVGKIPVLQSLNRIATEQRRLDIKL
jgi:hypothetical protein